MRMPGGRGPTPPTFSLSSRMEYDLIVMSLVIFLPTVFALALLFFPRGSDEYMRWWSLLGTAVTLVLSLWLFIDYQRGVLDFNRANPDNALLNKRALDDLSERAKTNAPTDGD